MSTTGRAGGFFALKHKKRSGRAAQQHARFSIFIMACLFFRSSILLFRYCALVFTSFARALDLMAVALGYLLDQIGRTAVGTGLGNGLVPGGELALWVIGAAAFARAFAAGELISMVFLIRNKCRSFRNPRRIQMMGFSCVIPDVSSQE